MIINQPLNNLKQKAMTTNNTTAAATTKITLYGGFHNSPAISIRIPSKYVEDLKDGQIALDEILTESQRKKLDRHFCGIKGCTCGSYMRATIEF